MATDDTKNLQNAELEGLMDKLRKMQRLYEGALAINSEEEAAAVAGKMQTLLTKYNLTLADLEVDEAEANPIIRDNVSGFTFRGIGGRWELNLTHVLCNHNLCRMLYTDSAHLTIIGRRENVEMVKWLKDTLARRFVVLGAEKFKEEQRRAREAYGADVRTLGKDTYLRHYLFGATQGLDARLKAQEAAAQTADPTYGAQVTALTVRNGDAIQAYMDVQYPHLRKRTLNVPTGAGYGAGYRAGYDTDIHRPITANTARQASGIGLLR